ncbi:unnamed protein product, partial [Symbiodinium pilosum]
MSAGVEEEGKENVKYKEAAGGRAEEPRAAEPQPEGAERLAAAESPGASKKEKKSWSFKRSNSGNSERVEAPPTSTSPKEQGQGAHRRRLPWKRNADPDEKEQELPDPVVPPAKAVTISSVPQVVELESGQQDEVLPHSPSSTEQGQGATSPGSYRRRLPWKRNPDPDTKEQAPPDPVVPAEAVAISPVPQVSEPDAGKTKETDVPITDQSPEATQHLEPVEVKGTAAATAEQAEAKTLEPAPPEPEARENSVAPEPPASAVQDSLEEEPAKEGADAVAGEVPEDLPLIPLQIDQLPSEDNEDGE